ncbi:hypothetical protein [Qipengyuania vesicularis]|uniref:hypothetical protein n=1 Tax=Qipengyuania vesicularis TaxID=2867232 RepID=UPI001C878D4B|nr:hypothetical protein [Qipengyuania vesicularis]MBX7526899.1 hypothetical protein [Qipengyuania vesicularis]
MMRITASVALAALGCAGCAYQATEVEQANVVQTSPEWRAVDAETGKITDLEGLSALSRDFPDSGSVRLRLLNAQLQAGYGPALIETLRWLQQRGYVFSEGAQAQIPKLVGEEVSEAAKALLLSGADPIERSEVAWTVPAKAGLVESVFILPARDAVVVSSLTGRMVWGREGERDWSGATIDGADNLSGFAGFTDSEELWVASGNIDGSKDEQTYFSGLLGSVPGSGDPRVAAPEGVTLSDLHAAADRTIFASDPLGGGVYKLGPNRERIEVVVKPGTFRSPQGLATSADGKRLYVSDYRYGIAIIDLASGTVSRLVAEIPAILDGADALFRRGNSLIAIQNGTSPMRISQFVLSDDGVRVIAHHILEQAHSEWTEPLSGHLSPDALFYIGNGQWDKYVAGELADGKTPDPTQIRRLPIE